MNPLKTHELFCFHNFSVPKEVFRSGGIAHMVYVEVDLVKMKRNAHHD